MTNSPREIKNDSELYSQRTKAGKHYCQFCELVISRGKRKGDTNPFRVRKICRAVSLKHPGRPMTDYERIPPVKYKSCFTKKKLIHPVR
jgi:hypothetical protein